MLALRSHTSKTTLYLKMYALGIENNKATSEGGLFADY